MRFDFQNLGSIKKTSLDLRPLTVIVGPNNTNKTYLAYCVHGLAYWLHGSWAYRFIATGKANIDIELAEAVTSTQALVNRAASNFTRGIREYFQDTYGGLFKDTQLGVQIDEAGVREGLQSLAQVKPDRFELTDQKVVIHGIPSKDARARQVPAGFCESIVSHASRAPLTLPAERNALVMTYKMLSSRRYRVLRDRERYRAFHRRDKAREAREQALLREQGDIRYPAPIEDFLDFLTDVELNAARPRNDATSPFGKLASTIEQHIQSGHRTGFEATRLGGSELALSVSDKLRVDLYNASSSIKQLAPLLLYLRYRAAPRQLLIIDEPEMNLHPEGQAKLLEALGMLANLGVHVLLTTHSPYFMAHLNNLIAADTGSPARKKRQARHLYMGDPAAFLAPDQVSAYEMRADGLASLADPEYGIRWDTLSDVSSELQRRYFAIVEEPKGRGKGK